MQNKNTCGCLKFFFFWLFDRNRVPDLSSGIRIIWTFKWIHSQSSTNTAVWSLESAWIRHTVSMMLPSKSWAIKLGKCQIPLLWGISANSLQAQGRGFITNHLLKLVYQNVNCLIMPSQRSCRDFVVFYISFQHQGKLKRFQPGLNGRWSDGRRKHKGKPLEKSINITGLLPVARAKSIKTLFIYDYKSCKTDSADPVVSPPFLAENTWTHWYLLQQFPFYVNLFVILINDKYTCNDKGILQQNTPP